MGKKNNYLDRREDFSAPPGGTADYPKRPEHRVIERNDKRK